jgi:hypothetical protein
MIACRIAVGVEQRKVDDRAAVGDSVELKAALVDSQLVRQRAEVK